MVSYFPAIVRVCPWSATYFNIPPDPFYKNAGFIPFKRNVARHGPNLEVL